MARVLVQNRMNLALPLLPDVLKQTGVATRKLARHPDVLCVLSPGGRYDQLYLSNYALTKCGRVFRLPGVGDMFFTGQRDYSMRIWVDPEKLSSRNLSRRRGQTIREHNAQVASGQIGQPRSPPGQETQITWTRSGRLKDPEQFEEHRRPHHAPTAALSASRTSPGSSWEPRNEDVKLPARRQALAGGDLLPISRANALEIAERLHAKLEDLKEFPRT